MGKPYAKELKLLSETYAWARSADIGRLAQAVLSCAPFPLLAVGSGGALTAANIACGLHQHHSGTVAKALTPLECVSSPLCLGDVAVMILSAGGKNADAIASSQNAILREPRRCVVLCLRGGSPLSELAKEFRYVSCIDDLVPSAGRDGFLATNSLLAFSVLLTRAYSHAFSSVDDLPTEFRSLFSQTQSEEEYFHQLRAACRPLWERETLVALYGCSVQAAALDLESKFSEGSLGNVQIADLRNFAHGRHHWLAKRGAKSGVLALFSEDERDMAERTLRLIPPGIPVVRICVPGGRLPAPIAAVAAVLHVVGAAGESRRIDPGRPCVPAFGRKIYGLRVLRGFSPSLPTLENAAIARKLGCEVSALRDVEISSYWRKAYHRFIESLVEASFGAAVFDYDGTLCDEQDRLSGIRPEITDRLVQLLEAGVRTGIATGRGRSVSNDLRKVLPRALWKYVHLGYYNGSRIEKLTEQPHLNSSDEPCESLRGVMGSLHEDPLIAQCSVLETRTMQISIQAKGTAFLGFVRRRIQDLGRSHDVKVLHSSHSIDLLPRGVSKLSLVAELEALTPKGSHVLVVGDKGQWPGNDSELLSVPYSLSVAEVSSDPRTCWNLAPLGHRGPQAALDYLDALQLSKRTFRISRENLVARFAGRGRE